MICTRETTDSSRLIYKTGKLRELCILAELGGISNLQFVDNIGGIIIDWNPLITLPLWYHYLPAVCHVKRNKNIDTTST